MLRLGEIEFFEGALLNADEHVVGSVHGSDEGVEFQLDRSCIPGSCYEDHPRQEHRGDAEEQVEDEGPVIVEAKSCPGSDTDGDRKARCKEACWLR